MPDCLEPPKGVRRSCRNHELIQAMQDLERWHKGGEEAKAVTPDGYFGAPNPIDPDLRRHFDLTARVTAKALAGERKGSAPRPKNNRIALP